MYSSKVYRKCTVSAHVPHYMTLYYRTTATYSELVSPLVVAGVWVEMHVQPLTFELYPPRPAFRVDLPIELSLGSQRIRELEIVVSVEQSHSNKLPLYTGHACTCNTVIRTVQSLNIYSLKFTQNISILHSFWSRPTPSVRYYLLSVWHLLSNSMTKRLAAEQTNSSFTRELFS